MTRMVTPKGVFSPLTETTEAYIIRQDLHDFYDQRPEDSLRAL